MIPWWALTKKTDSALKHKNIPLKVSASVGFSEGMKRDIASLVSDNVSDKRQWVIHTLSTTKNNFVHKLEISKTNEPRSVSCISGLTLATNTAESLSIIQCSANWIQMQHSVQLEQNKKELKLMWSIICLKTWSLYHHRKGWCFLPKSKVLIIWCVTI